MSDYTTRRHDANDWLEAMARETPPQHELPCWACSTWHLFPEGLSRCPTCNIPVRVDPCEECQGEGSIEFERRGFSRYIEGFRRGACPECDGLRAFLAEGDVDYSTDCDRLPGLYRDLAELAGVRTASGEQLLTAAELWRRTIEQARKDRDHA
jgi:hypothetical protein